MKRFLFTLLALCMIAAPAMSDTWKFTPTVTGDADHINLYHAPLAEGMTAQEFIAQDPSVFTLIEISATEPTTFTLDYADETLYAIWGEAVSLNDDRFVVMDSVTGGMSPTVWPFTAIPPIIDAHFGEVETTPDGSVQIIINVGR